jgi:hypothetical protein
MNVSQAIQGVSDYARVKKVGLRYENFLHPIHTVYLRCK